MGREDVYGMISTRVTVGSGNIVQIGPIEGMVASSIKLISGGTLEIGQYSSSQGYGFTALVGSSAAIQAGGTFGQGYFLSSNEILSVNMSGKFYLYASGAECVVAVLFGRSAGF
jgi:hypothetical protein